MDNSLTDRPALGKNPPGYYAIVPRSVITNQTLSPGAKDLFALLDSFLGGRSHRVSNTRLADELKVSLRSITYYLQELEFAGLLIRKRTGRATIFTLINEARKEPKTLRNASAFLSDTQDLADPQSIKPLVIKNKQQGEGAPLEGSPFPSADVPAGAKPFKVLNKEKRDYVSAFNSSLEIHLGACLDLNSLKEETLKALVNAQDQGIEARDLASKCSLKLNQEQQAKAINGSPIRSPIAYLVSVLPSWVDSELWSSSNQVTPDYAPNSEHLPHTYFESDSSEPMSEETKEIWEKVSAELREKARVKALNKEGKNKYGVAFDEPPF